MNQEPIHGDARHGVCIYGYSVNGHQVIVDIYGGTESTVGSLYYEIEEEERRNKMLSRLEEWAENEIPLTYVSDQNGMGVLMRTADYLMFTYDA